MLSADRGNEKANATAAKRRRRRRTSSCCLQCSLQGSVALWGIFSPRASSNEFLMHPRRLGTVGTQSSLARYSTC